MSFKQVIVVRKDLGLSAGKIAAQAAHASSGAILDLHYNYLPSRVKHILQCWKDSGMKKVVLKVNSESEILEIQKQLEYAGFSTYLVKDAARTQLKEPAITALGVEPSSEEAVDKITKHLSLY